MQRLSVSLLASIVILAIGIFMIDLMVPLGVAVWIPYVGVVLLSLWLPRRAHVYATATSCTLLVFLGLMFDPDQGEVPFWIAGLNRLFGVIAIWIAAVVGMAARRTHELEEANRRLQQEIIEREKLQAQLLRTQRLESIGVLASGIAHDLNNLLTPIVMSAKLLKEDRREPERRRLLETLLASAERGGDIIRQMLAFAGGGEAEHTLVQVGHVVREVKSILEHTFPKGIQIEVLMDDGLRTVRGDTTQLTQVLMNLCVNARDAMPNGGHLRISARNVEVQPGVLPAPPRACAGPHIVVAVEDTGTGISPGVLDKVFDPFFTTKEHGKGTGLGLSTALGIVNGHGGFIDVASTPGRGSRFSVYLPVNTEMPGPAPTPEIAKASRGNGETILVVDDEAMIVETAAIALKGYGYDVLTAADGHEALALFKERREAIAAAVVDIMMPVMDGAATIDALRALHPTLPIIASSGLRPKGKIGDAVAGGKLAFLQKPYTDEQLLDMVATVL